MKIDYRKRYGIILDTETANTHQQNNILDMRDVLPYDFGFMVIDTKGRIYETYSFVNSDIFFNETTLMNTAYYSKKLPQYYKDISAQKRKVANTYQIRKVMMDLIHKYNCKFIMAHNMKFDYRACNNILKWTTKSKYRYFFPKDIELWDTMKMAQDVICSMPTYKQFCIDNNYLTKNNQPKKTAEVLYRFISSDNNFIEKHTGLEDVKIELEIYKYCKKQHKKMRKKLYEN